MRQEKTGFWDGSDISWTICKQSAPFSRQITIPNHKITTNKFPDKSRFSRQLVTLYKQRCRPMQYHQHWYTWSNCPRHHLPVHCPTLSLLSSSLFLLRPQTRSPAVQIHRMFIITQPSDGPLCGTTQVIQYRKKHSSTHTHEEEEGFAQTTRSNAWELIRFTVLSASEGCLSVCRNMIWVALLSSGHPQTTSGWSWSWDGSRYRTNGQHAKSLTCQLAGESTR